MSVSAQSRAATRTYQILEHWKRNRGVGKWLTVLEGRAAPLYDSVSQSCSCSSRSLFFRPAGDSFFGSHFGFVSLFGFGISSGGGAGISGPIFTAALLTIDIPLVTHGFWVCDTVCSMIGNIEIHHIREKQQRKNKDKYLPKFAFLPLVAIFFSNPCSRTIKFQASWSNFFLAAVESLLQKPTISCFLSSAFGYFRIFGIISESSEGL